MCSDNGLLTQHIKIIHDKIKDFKCDKCEYVCSSKDHLQRHIKQIHAKIKDFKCEKCDFTCSLKENLKNHVNQIHNRPIMDKRMSLGEYAIYDYLTKNNIEFEKEMKFKDLVSPKNKQLRYDFYIKSHNLLIEFDGRQHYEKIKWTSAETINDVNEHFNYIVECDHLKNEYADANKIKLYRIKYTEIKNIENILKVLLI
jgi:very-short-patch-repair endonuclease